ncbi:MAG TPA: cytochrome c oxidase subunit II, partial [Candidatus Binatia bacterium]|nr:cytochrome c oxidase subunit II [Candidatus Binatia bacterium]
MRPAGPFAEPLAEITWVMLGVGLAVLVIVLVVLWIALGDSKLRREIAKPRTILIGGFLFPVVVLSASLVYGLWTTARVAEPPRRGEMRIRVVGEMWWWRVTYFDGDRPLFETANEIRIPVGAPVTFELESADVIHSFWVPEIAPKLDMIPGRRNIVRGQANRAGIYRGMCTEYCGAAHALMAFEVVALEQGAFEAWRDAQAAPASGFEGEGARLFDRVGCAACHAVRGEANGRVGPDLTHVASRRTLAAGVLPNDAPTMRRWIEHADELKPGVRMPS